MEKNDLAMMKAENERLATDLERLKQRLREEITRTQAGVRLDLNLEKGSFCPVLLFCFLFCLVFSLPPPLSLFCGAGSKLCTTSAALLVCPTMGCTRSAVRGRAVWDSEGGSAWNVRARGAAASL